VTHKPTLPAPPLALSMVLADHVHRDQATGKYFILGTYNALMTQSFPLLTRLVVYAALTDGHGLVPLRLVLIDADESLGPISALDGAVQVADPTRMWEVIFTLQGVVIPKPGQYLLQLFSGESLLREMRLEVRTTRVGVTREG
jgi:hypothetical protein